MESQRSPVTPLSATQPTAFPTTPPPEATLPKRHPDAPAPGELIVSHYRFCYGCGKDHEAGLHIVNTAGEGLTLTAEFHVTDLHQGSPGLAHGGLLAAAFDEALGALNWLLLAPAVTARLETDFRRPVPVDSVLFIDARITGVVGRKVYTAATGRLGGPDGELAVQAAALFIQVGVEHFTANGRKEEVDQALAERAAAQRIGSFEVNP